jgi:hypothetical protein
MIPSDKQFMRVSLKVVNEVIALESVYFMED